MESYTFQFDGAECRGGSASASRVCERRGPLGSPALGCAADAFGRFTCYRGDPRFPGNFSEYRGCVSATAPPPYPLCGPTAFTCLVGSSRTAPVANNGQLLGGPDLLARAPWEWIAS